MKSKGSRPGVKGPGCDGWGMSVDQLDTMALEGLEMDVGFAQIDPKDILEKRGQYV